MESELAEIGPSEVRVIREKLSKNFYIHCLRELIPVHPLKRGGLHIRYSVSVKCSKK